MAERPDLRQIAVSIGEALSGYEKADLAQMLTYVFKEYVVEGAPPVLVSQVDGIEALEGLSFAEVIEQLQARLDVPELEHFSVQNGQVMVRVGGVMSPIGSGAGPGDRAMRSPSPMSTPAPSGRGTSSASTPGPAGPRATADEATRRGRGDLVGGQRGEVQAPRPRGISVGSSALASGGPASPVGSNTPGSTPPTETPPAGAPPDTEPDDKPAVGDDDASVRFSLLELD